jgi:tRNA nucleotidyltransferase (CCA-adding enzyme)
MSEQLFRKAKEVIRQFHKHGFQAYIVGGAVRDYLLKREIADIDIATSAKPQQIMEIFPKVIPTGIQHGTVLVRYQNDSFEVTTFRTDGQYDDFRHPSEVFFVNDLKLDLARRDFTLNAIAMTENLDYIDPFKGQEAIANKIITTVGDANKRINEDPLRIMRAVRFSSQLHFRIDNNTLESINEHAHLIQKISIERVAVEWEKLIKGDNIRHALTVFFNVKLHQYIPILKDDVRTVDFLKKIDNPIPSWSCFIAAATWKNAHITIADWTKQWKLSNQIKRNATTLSNCLHDYIKGEEKLALYNLPESSLNDFARLIQLITDHTISVELLRKRKMNLPIQSRKDIVIDGTMLIELSNDKTPGKWIHEMLQQMEKEIVNGHLTNDVKILSEWIKNA